jgi:hypothetical protein
MKSRLKKNKYLNMEMDIKMKMKVHNATSGRKHSSTGDKNIHIILVDYQGERHYELFGISSSAGNFR